MTAMDTCGSWSAKVTPASSMFSQASLPFISAMWFLPQACFPNLAAIQYEIKAVKLFKKYLAHAKNFMNTLKKNCCCSAAQSCPALCDRMDCSTPGVLSFTISWSLLKVMSIESVMPSNHLILYCPLLLPSIFPSIRVFSSELALHIRWPKYWSFSFSISPFNEY